MSDNDSSSLANPLDVFGRGKVVQGTIYLNIRFKFRKGSFRLGWLSKGEKNPSWKDSIDDIKKHINIKNGWLQHQIDAFFLDYDTYFSIDRISKSLNKSNANSSASPTTTVSSP